MKKVFLTTIATSLIASSSFAFEPIKLNSGINKNIPALKIDMQKLAKAGKIQDVLLFDGRTINIKKDVESINVFENKIDLLQLNNGEVVDRYDIDKIQIRLGGRTERLLATGVDGGG